MFTQKTLTYLLLLLPLFVQAQPAPEVTFKKKRFHLTFQQVNNLILVDLTINAIAIDKVRHILQPLVQVFKKGMSCCGSMGEMWCI